MQDEQYITVRVAIQRPLYHLLDYSCERDLKPLIGCRVRVNLGNRPITAIVVDVDVVSKFETLKPILEVLDKESLLDAPMIALLQWASRYYFYPMGEVLFHALPNALRKGKQAPQQTLWFVTTPYVNETLDSSQNVSNVHPPPFEPFLESLKRSPKQKQLFEFLLENGESDAIQLATACGKTWRSALQQLIKKGVIGSSTVEADYFPVKPKKLLESKKSLRLTDEQQMCVDSIQDCFKQIPLKPILLHGITGSGKTEVYLRAIEDLLDQGKQILVLVPEIGLTPQLLTRFQQHYPQYEVVSHHSGLSDGDRTRAWLGAKKGAIQILIGTRSSVFAPMPNLGAIVIDEEHDASFKQQEGFLYHGRDMAIKRAYDANVPVLLGSATPSLESLHNVQQQRYHLLRLSKRPGVSKPPEIALQDIRGLQLEAGISPLLLVEIRQHLAKNNQVMLFLNRRGFAPVLMCQDCGWHANCHQCERGMTYHAKLSKVVCHHCQLEQAIGAACPECQKTRLTTLGQGTERIEAVLGAHFPEVPIVRIDRDTTNSKDALENKLNSVHQGDPVILVGTQMLTKGHDFPKLTLVGILDVDQALFSMDYRSQERLAQQILQVAGRAGRAKDKGRVILQTSQAQHPLLLNLLGKGYIETAKQILSERALWQYPPFGYQALIKVNAPKEQSAKNFASLLKSNLVEIEETNIDVLGPLPSPLPKRANRYRFQLVLSAQKRVELHQFLEKVLMILSSQRRTGDVRWRLDVDPTDFS